jgi:PAS domain S-box-containing protein
MSVGRGRSEVAGPRWLGELENVSVGLGVSLLLWRSGGFEHPRDMPPYLFMPSPTFEHSSRLVGWLTNEASMAHRDPSSPTAMPAIFRYGIAILSVAIAIGLDFLLLRRFEAILTPFLFAVAAAVWYAGTGPGVLAIVLSVLSLNYFFLHPFFSFGPISYADVVYLTFCIFCALAVGWVSAVRRRAEQKLRQAREELDAKVVERTASLQRSERYLAEAQRLGHCGVAAYNETTVLYGSEEIYRIWGFDPAQGVPSRKAVFQRIHPDDRDRLNAEVQRAVGEKRRYSIGYRIVLPDGTVKHLESTGQPVFSASGNLVEIVSTQLDVTDRKRAADALREREAQLAEARRELRQMIDTIPIPVASYSADARRDFVNAAWKQYTGLSDEAALGTEWSVVAHPDHIATGEKMWHDAFATGEPWHTEERVRRADGQYHWFAIDRVAARDENGKIIKWYGTAYDIEDRKRAEERIRVQHTVALILAEAATIEEATPRILWAMGECLGWDVGALWRVDHEAEMLRCVELWHKASMEVPEFEKASRECTFVPGLGLPGRVWSSLEPEYVPDVVPDENFPRGPIAEREGLHAAFGFPILLAGEVQGVIEFFSREIRQPDQELLNMLATVGSQIGQFIERKRAEEAFRKAQLELAHANRVAMMGQLTTTITHEVNQPITAAITYALAARRFLNAEPPNFHEVDDALALIVKEGNRAGDVIERVRALIKKLPVRKDAVAIDDAILEVIALTRTEAANNSVSVRTQFAEGLPRVQGDRVQLQQVTLNLIVNSIQAMSNIGEGARELQISIDAVPSEGSVRVGVRDSGPGLSPESFSRLFEPFYTTKPEGMGMGLSICRSIIEAHGGRLWATPCDPQGALFQFTVPADWDDNGAR